MNYKKIYNNLVERRLVAPPTGYCEKHHIVPKCMGGTDASENIVKLSAREHYIAHILLARIYGTAGLISAAILMGAQTGATSRVFAKLREKFSTQQSLAQTGEKNSQYGTKWVYSVDLQISKKIRAEEEVPEGFAVGRVLDFTKVKSPSKKDTTKAKNVQLYTELYKLYNQVGWQEFVTITGYDKTKQNFVQMCARHAEGFVPQNGKSRGTSNKESA